MSHWRESVRYGILSVLMFFLILPVNLLLAQPSSAILADQLEGVFADRIQNIDHLRIGTVSSGGMFEGMETSTLYEKVTRDGREMLIEVEEEGMYEGAFHGIADDILSGMVRNSSSIAEEQLGEYAVYRVEVDDPAFLSGLQTAEAFADEEMEEDDFTIESATIYIDRNDLLLRYSSFRQAGPDGQTLTINFEMDDYRSYSGFPVPHIMRLEVEGLDQMFSDDELAEAREAMREMEAQLESMPEAQRNMIESQIRPQIERFEAMIEQGDAGNVEIQVTDVRVNTEAEAN